MNEQRGALEDIARLAKRRGFLYSGSELYGGLAGTYDYGPMGVPLRNTIRESWRSSMIHDHDTIVEIDSSIMMHPRVWEASGHLGGFADPLVEHKPTNERFRVDHLLEAIGVYADEKMSVDDIQKLFDEHFDNLALPSKKREDYTSVRTFNLLVQSNFGNTTTDMTDPVYLRGETAQGIYINYKNILDSTTLKIPFGVAQIGKAFRNEIKPRQFVFRMREFEQMEMQYFVHPDDSARVYEEWKEERMRFYVERLGIDQKRLRFKQHENLVFYAKDAWDIEYEFDFGWKEVEGIHHRGDYDLTQHGKFSGKDLSYTDPYSDEKYIPHVLETSVGTDRLVFMMLEEAYCVENIQGDDDRVVMRFPAQFAPVRVAVSPLVKNKPELVEKAREVYEMVRSHIPSAKWDDNGNIGKRYRRQDEIGTPHCVVVDFDTLEDNTVTVRDRDSMKQIRVSIDDVVATLT